MPTSAAPPHAIPCWVDNHSLYFELRGVNGPHVVAFARHEISKALTILFATFENEGHGEPYLRPAPIARKFSEDGITQTDLNKAREALKALGILK